MPDEIKEAPHSDDPHVDTQKGDVEDKYEVFKRGDGQVDFRTVSWIRASVIFLKIIFATGVLSIPSLMYELGAFPGAITVVGWSLLNTYCALVQGNFRNAYPGCHSIADMAQVVGGPVVKELVGALFTISYVIVAASGIIGVSTAFNALSLHSVCTVWFSFIGTIIIAMCASVRKFSHIGWLTWLGFGSVYVAVFIIVYVHIHWLRIVLTNQHIHSIGVTVRDRPAAAPQTGDFDLGYRVIGNPDFTTGITASAAIFVSSAATSAFLPVISEMRRPKDYPKAVYLSMTLVTASYLTFSLVIYAWCGKWIASPSLGSAGETVKRIAYGIALPGLIISGCLYVHVAAKYLFVRILRNSRHLQANTAVHWGTWLSCTIGTAAISFVLASAIPIFNYVLALVGSLCFAPLAISLPGWLWVYSHRNYWRGNWFQVALYVFHVFLILLGLFMAVGGTYGVVVQISKAYQDGQISSAFSCADNS
ncbi:unnamed protein product [Penicillium salamii]|uniref:Amino acid transporter transmembrane domain-containing protein n=1 Tax=Penicillium salamii TaxID=1612424 RepID=A0A9W4N4E4_9EURO|nr:unnamed protein product [Penicillium salamii]CAG7960946.1 unnamed protein product [Penicillium salamii]CAG7964554.1 unnamed protein product [Penicillium salamii]CAG7982357.1 unnamed protein product [Penicillium salamii]CAG8126116.1 unnamed protein product [Penicillium salamii]